VKTLLLKLAFGILAVSALQVRLGSILEGGPHRVRDPLDAQFQAGARSIVFGDSVHSFVHPSDADLRPLTGMLQDRLPAHPLNLLNGPAYAADLYLSTMEYAVRERLHPRCVVVPLNLRSFSPVWDQRPAYQYPIDRWRLRYGDPAALALARPMTIYNVYAEIEGYPPSDEEYQKVSLMRGDERMGTVREVIDGRGKWGAVPLNQRAYSAIYLSPLTAGHRKLRSLARLAALCRENGIPLLMYVTPIDVEAGEAILGPGFRLQVTRNIDVLRRSLEGPGCTFQDLGFLLPSAMFDQQEVPNEHLREQGRRRLAEILATWIQSQP
jgi:hypothetical protein